MTLDGFSHSICAGSAPPPTVACAQTVSPRQKVVFAVVQLLAKVDTDAAAARKSEQTPKKITESSSFVKNLKPGLTVPSRPRRRTNFMARSVRVKDCVKWHLLQYSRFAPS